MKDYKKICADCACLVNVKGAWCCDECFGQKCEDLDECPEGIESAEVTECQDKDTKVKHGASSSGRKSTPRTVKTSDEKTELFAEIVKMLTENGYNYTIAKENKLIEVEIGNGIAIDLKEHRKK